MPPDHSAKIRTHFMQNLSTDYPAAPWEPGWRFCSTPEDAIRFVTTNTRGHITSPGADWLLQLADPSLPGSTQMLYNGLSIRGRKQRQYITLFSVDDGVLTGTFSYMPPPTLSGKKAGTPANGQTWIKAPHGCTLLLCRESRFALVTGALAEEPALTKAEEALNLRFDTLLHNATDQRRPIANLFSINSRHNPPVALAAETLQQRLRGPVANLHGTWSTSDGFEHETFSLNDLYPLTRAWILIHPETALKLVQTALSLQQPSGGFPAWVNDRGETASTAPWPTIVQSFEQAWAGSNDPVLLKKHLPALRKYMQWALRYFDPHRDRVPAWQSEQETFVPNSFERDKATPDLTVLLLTELEALLRLCNQNEHAQTAVEQLKQEHQHLSQTLETLFWNPETKQFSNAWKNGHTLHDPSYASFTPLLLSELPDSFKKPLLENFETTHGFPGQKPLRSWKQEQIDDIEHLPAIHQFTTLEALRRSDSKRALLSLFIRRAREGFAAWFERERIETARLEEHTNRSARHTFSLGPVTAALILCSQDEFRRDTTRKAPVHKTLQHWTNKLRLTAGDIKIVIGTLITILIAHLLYNLTVPINADAQMAEAALSYRQGRLSDTLQLCRRHPNHPLSQFLLANLLMITDNPVEAEALYLKVLRVKTESPSALFGYALALQRNEKFDLAIRRYNDFIDIHEQALSNPRREDLIDLAYEFIRLAEEGFSNPPRWKQVFAYPEMNDLGL